MDADSAGASQETDLYRHAMIGAGTIWEVEAAVRLVHQSPAVWRFVVDGGFIRPSEVLADAWIIQFEDAMKSAWVRGSGVSESDQVVLKIATSLAGHHQLMLRHILSGLEPEAAKLVAEAIMYASGFMDGEADPEAHDGPDGSSGPNRLEFERRVSCDY